MLRGGCWSDEKLSCGASSELWVALTSAPCALDKHSGRACLLRILLECSGPYMQSRARKVAWFQYGARSRRFRIFVSAASRCEPSGKTSKGLGFEFPLGVAWAVDSDADNTGELESSALSAIIWACVRAPPSWDMAMLGACRGRAATLLLRLQCYYSAACTAGCRACGKLLCCQQLRVNSMAGMDTVLIGPDRY